MASWQDTPTEAPSLFTCPLTMEIFRGELTVGQSAVHGRSTLRHAPRLRTDED